MRALIHVANLLFLASYLVSDILWLRCLTLVAGALLVVYFAAEGQREPVAWNLIFLALNVAQLARIIRDRRPVHLSPDEATLHRLAFSALSPRAFSKIARLGAFCDATVGDELLAEGKPAPRLIALLDGRVRIEARGTSVAELGPGRLIGEMSFLTRDATTARAVAHEPCRYLALPAEGLRKALEADADLRAALQLVIGRDLVSKVKRG